MIQCSYCSCFSVLSCQTCFSVLSSRSCSGYRTVITIQTVLCVLMFLLLLFQCIVQSYLQWLQDSDYSPNCSLCSNVLADEAYGECVRLTCYGRLSLCYIIMKIKGKQSDSSLAERIAVIIQNQSNVVLTYSK